MAFEPDFDYFIKRMTPEEREKFERVCTNLKKNPFASRPLWPFMSPRWIYHKIRYIMREVKLWWSEGEDVV